MNINETVTDAIAQRQEKIFNQQKDIPSSRERDIIEWNRAEQYLSDQIQSDRNPHRLMQLSAITPKFFKKGMPRWGCKFKCHCGAEVITGGKRSLLEISRFVADQKGLHRETCKHPRYKEKWSLHATEVDHTVVKQTTEQSTTSTSYTDLSGISIANTNFTSGRDYWLLHTGWLDLRGTNTQEPAMQFLHASTVFVTSENERDIIGVSNTKHAWNYLWSAADETVKAQFKTSSSTAYYDNGVFMAMEMSEDFTVDADYHWSFTSTTDTQDGTYGGLQDQSITIDASDHEEDDRYLVIAQNYYSPTSTSANYFCRISRSGGASDDTIFTTEEGEDTSTELISLMLPHVYTLNDASNTFTTDMKNDGGGGFSRFANSIFAFNIELLAIQAVAYTEASTTIDSATDYNYTPQTTTITPTISGGDIFMMGWLIFDAGAPGSRIKFRLRYENDSATMTDGPATFNVSNEFTRDNSDNVVVIQMDVQAMDDDEAHTVEINANDLTENSGTAERREILAFSFELPASAGFAYSQGCVIG